MVDELARVPRVMINRAPGEPTLFAQERLVLLDNDIGAGEPPILCSEPAEEIEPLSGGSSKTLPRVDARAPSAPPSERSSPSYRFANSGRAHPATSGEVGLKNESEKIAGNCAKRCPGVELIRKPRKEPLAVACMRRRPVSSYRPLPGKELFEHG
jgi:hypothetical protein